MENQSVSRDEAYDAVGLRDLYAQTVRVAIDAVPVLSIGLLAVSAIGFNRVAEELFAVVVALVGVAACANWSYRYGATFAAGCLVVGLTAVFGLALCILRSDLVSPWFSIVVLITCALFGWRWGAVHTVLAFGLLLIAAGHGMPTLSVELATNAILLGSVALFISWLISRPTRTALEWASSSYLQELALVQEARERQAELARLSKNLGESNHLLEQLNLELDQARRAAHQARQLKEQFAAAVSHELRTPLNLIIGFCEMMVLSPVKAYGKSLPPNYRNDLEAIYRNAVHISTLVDDILDLSQIDADRMALRREWVSLGDVIMQATGPVSSLFRNRGLMLEVQMDNDLPLVFVDATRIRQILINLLANAARFTDQGGVTIRVRRDEAGVVVLVADTGPGIPPEELPYIFDEFRQVSSVSPRAGGSGLGLAVSKRFAEMHGGSISVESEIGRGTTFALHLPVDSSTIRPGAVPSWDDRLGRRVRGKAERLVLVVDESKELERVVARYLDDYHVVTLADLHRHDDGTIADVLQAVVVGSEGDREFWRQLSAESPRLWRLPVFSCSLQTGQRAIAHLGVTDYLVKPITRDHLRMTLRRHGCAPKKATKILIVDDDPEILLLLTRMVKSISRQYQVITAADGSEALALMRQNQPDCVLLDLRLPRVDGYQVIEMMRQDPQFCALPIFVMTAAGIHRESILVDELNIKREGGLTVAEAMRLLKVGLDSLATPVTSAPAPTAVPAA
jgi:signal transduction histidine kinase/CheY-like chemotaxis protein